MQSTFVTSQVWVPIAAPISEQNAHAAAEDRGVHLSCIRPAGVGRRLVTRQNSVGSTAIHKKRQRRSRCRSRLSNVQHAINPQLMASHHAEYTPGGRYKYIHTPRHATGTGPRKRRVAQECVTPRARADPHRQIVNGARAPWGFAPHTHARISHHADMHRPRHSSV